MSYFILNTERNHLIENGCGNPRWYWINTGCAYTTGDYRKYGTGVLGRLNMGDVIFAYENKVGIISIGHVMESWDGQACPREGLFLPLSRLGIPLYKIQVQWDWSIGEGQEHEAITFTEIRNCGYTGLVNRTLISLSDEVGEGLVAMRSA